MDFWQELGLSFFRGWVLLCLALWVLQRSFLYQPTTYSQEDFRRLVLQMPPVAGAMQSPEVLPFFDALVFTPSSSNTPLRGTAVLFHGNAGSSLHRHALAPEFMERGWRLVLAEYPGYGARQGPISEESLVRDAMALTKAVARRYPGESVLLVGESLGSGVAVQVAAQLTRESRDASVPAADSLAPPGGLVLLTPFDSLRDTAARIAWFVPARWLVEDVFDSKVSLAHFSGSVRMLIAGRDEVVGAHAGLDLAGVARGRPNGSREASTQVILLPEAGHNTWRYDVTAAQWDVLLAPLSRFSLPTDLRPTD